MSSWAAGLLGLVAQKSRAATLCGYLWKMKRAPKMALLSPQWTRRFFSIEGRRLKWYDSESSTAEKGSVDLRTITGVSRFEPGNKGVSSFIVCCPERNLLLRASSAAEMEKWIRAIQTQADRARGGSGMGVITGLFPSMGQRRRGQHKPLSTLEKELDRIVQRLNFLENEIILNAEDVLVVEDARIPPRCSDSDEVEDEIAVVPPSKILQSPVRGFVPKRLAAPQPQAPRNALAELVDVDDGDYYRAYDCSDSEVSSPEASPAFVRQIPSRDAAVCPPPAVMSNAWTHEG
jgi:hypothetical protein